ncbi:hypothetical protein [Nonomuraea sp. NPDC002799]
MTFLDGSDLAMVVDRRPDCPPWCTQHAVLDDDTPFCNAADLPVFVREMGGHGSVSLTRFPGEVPLVQLTLSGGSDSLTVDEAENVAKQLMRQVARARGKDAS